MKNKYITETFPLFHTGYMDGKDVFSLLISAGLREALEDHIEKENICILNETVLKSFFNDVRLNSAFSASEAAAEKARQMAFCSHEGYGILQMLFDCTDWTIMAGSCAYDLYSAIGSGKSIYKCTAAEISSGRIILLDFLEVETVQELARIVRYAAYSLVRSDITGSSPRIETDSLTAVRPPYDEWGMTIKR